MQKKHAVFATFLACAALLAPAMAQAAVVAHWSFDKPFGDKNIYPDSASGASHPATPENKNLVKPFDGDAPFGDAVNLSGKDGSYFTIPPLNFLKGSFTVAAWFRLSGPGRNIILADWNEPDFSYQFGIDGKERETRLISDLRSPDIKPGEKRNRKLLPVSSVVPDVLVKMNQWNHAAWVWRRIDAAHGVMTVYLNGTKLCEIPSTYKSSDIQVNTKPAHIGYREFQKNVFNGAIDELWVFSEPLTATQIKNLMTNNNTGGTGQMAKVLDKDGKLLAMATPAAPVKPPAPTPAVPPAPTVLARGPAAPNTGAPAGNGGTAPGGTALTRGTPPGNTAPVSPSPEAAPPAPNGETLVGTGAPPAENPNPGDEQPERTMAANVAPTEPDDDQPKAVAAPVELPRSSDTGDRMLAVTPHGFGPGRIMGIIACAIIEVIFAGYFLWVMGERAKMRVPARPQTFHRP